LFDRPTPLDGDQAGLANWVRMFRGDVIKTLSADMQSKIFAAMEERLRPHLFCDGKWYADYRRLRLVAYKRSVT
jgi:trans-aconitate 2-methyltransferase